MLPKNQTKINALWDIVGNGTPPIGGGNWTLHRDQWRHEVTYNLGDFDVIQDWIAAKVYDYGYENVTLGQAWDADKCKPRPLDQYIGIYIRDIDLMAEKFKIEMEDEW